MKDKAMKQWLEALATEEYRLRQTGQSQVYSGIGFVITSLRQAIEQAEKQEPVAQYSDIVSDGGLAPRNKFDTPPIEQPAQRTWVGLTDEELYKIGGFKSSHGYVPTPFKRMMKDFEAKLKEKNA